MAVHVEMGTEVLTGRWGTWEELLLGGAVLRHGTQDWNLVASELRARTDSPAACNPEVCKAKYEDLQQRFLGCKTWYEELRKQRMAELRLALEKSEDSIGSLESKLVSLKAEKRDDFPAGYGSSQTESAIPFLKSEAIEFSSKEMSKDGLSAGSFTQEAQTKWSPNCQIPATVPAEEMDSKPGDSPISVGEKISSLNDLANTFCGAQLQGIRKRRGKRKRKDCSKDAKEGSVGESEFLGLADVASATWCKETSASNSAEIARSSGFEDQSRSPNQGGIDDMMGIFSSIAENDCASVFRRRLDSQKRGRYKKMILRHMDFDTISSRIVSNSILSVKELFHDMLLVANNALVFYSKNTREYKSALLLRHIVTAALRQQFKDNRSKVPTTTMTSSRPMHPPAKARSLPSGNSKLPGKAAKDNDGNAVDETSHASKKTTKTESPPSVGSLPVMKRGSAQPKKVADGCPSPKSKTPATKGRKGTRAQ